jgi:CBS domain-containing protein
MATIRQLLREKGHNVVTLEAGATVFDAISKMADENIGSIVVCDGRTPIGILTERHYARKVFLKGKASPNTLVRDIMETQVVFARPEHTVDECMAMMTEKKVRHLPVAEHGELIGIISIGDLVKHVISDQKFTIDQLTTLISG